MYDYLQNISYQIIMENEKLRRILLQIVYTEYKNIFEKLEGIRYAIIKGEVLSLLSYNQLGLRCYNDIDILVSRNNIAKVDAIFKSFEFDSPKITRENNLILKLFSHQTLPYRKKAESNKVIFDLNFDIFWGEYTGKRVDIDDFLSDTIDMNIYNCKVKALTPLKSMVQLILHHYKEMNSIYLLSSYNTIKYNMFKDVFYLLKSNTETISLQKLFAISSSYGIIPYVFYILYYTNQVFDDQLLKKYVEAFKTPEGINLLDYYGLAKKERKPWRVDFKTRLEAENLYDFIKNDLTDVDLEKIEQNKRIFC